MSPPRSTQHPRSFLGALLATLALVAIGCSSSNNTEPTATSSATSPPAVVTPTAGSPASSPSMTAGELSGTWTGQYSGTFQGTFTLRWVQSGPKLTGTIDLSTAGTLRINGLVTNGSIRFGTVGSTAITYSGTVSGNTMSGTYAVAGGGSGNWSATKS